MITIVIPCHNQAQYLRTAIDSALVQSRGDHEIVVVDDGSADGTSEVVREIAGANPGRKISLAVQSQQGLSAARNTGIEASQGDYILPLDADDFLHPEYLQRTAAVLDAEPQIGVVATARLNFGLHCSVVGRAAEPEVLPLVNQFGYCSLYRKSVWEEVGGYPLNYPRMGFEDWEFWIACREKGVRFHPIPEVLWYYRVRPDSMAQRAGEDAEYLMARIISRHPGLYAPESVAEAARIMEAQT